MGYYPRLIEKLLSRKLKSSGAVLLTGPKFCGKTTTCMQYQKSYVKLNTKQMIELARLDPKAMLSGESPHLIDEWQKAPDIWNQIKEDLDEHYEFGKYLLTGSSTPVDKTAVNHSGAGRITSLKMYPFSLLESGESSGAVSLQKLFDEPPATLTQLNENYRLSDTAYFICRGGWPISVLAAKEVALDVTKNYYGGLFYFEDQENERFRNTKPDIMRMVLRSYARNISSEASVQTMLDDVRQSNERTMDRKTFENYVEALKDLFIIEDMPAWSPNFRSKTAIRSTPVRHFVDTSIACAALQLSPDDLMADLKSFGLFFEDFAVRELRIYAQSSDGEVRHYRDSTGLECDAVVHRADGQWAAIEIKIGGDQLIEAGAHNLKLLAKKLEQKSDERPPAFMMVLTASGPAYVREDGVYVVPINLLGC